MSVKGISVKHPLSSTPERVSEEQLAVLVPRLRAGDTSAHEEIILGHVHLAISIAGRYARSSPHNVDDLISESIYGIIYAVKTAAEKLVDDSITPWIISCCHRFIIRYLSRDSVVRIPYQTLWARYKRGLRTNVATTRSITDHDIASRSREPSLEIRELIDFSAETEVDRQIVFLRAQGYKDKEIGERIGISAASVTRMRANIRARFKRWCKR